MFVAATSEFYN